MVLTEQTAIILVVLVAVAALTYLAWVPFSKDPGNGILGWSAVSGLLFIGWITAVMMALTSDRAVTLDYLLPATVFTAMGWCYDRIFAPQYVRKSRAPRD